MLQVDGISTQLKKQINQFNDHMPTLLITVQAHFSDTFAITASIYSAPLLLYYVQFQGALILQSHIKANSTHGDSACV